MTKPNPSSDLDSDPNSQHPIRWKGDADQIILSPCAGGRIISWIHGGHELVKPLGLEDGGLLRVMLGEERYPGSSYNTPHLVPVHRCDTGGFSVHLRYFWNTANALARQVGWLHKVNPVYQDGLLLDKIITFDAGRAALIVDLTITNLTGQERRLTPWLQSHFWGWVDTAFVVIGGEKQPYRWHDIYWDGHRAEPGKPMRLIHASRDGSLSVVQGAATDWLAGMASYTRVDYGGDSTDGCMELRGKTVTLASNQGWRFNTFLALTDGVDGWKRWATAAPALLFSEIVGSNHPDPVASGQQARGKEQEARGKEQPQTPNIQQPTPNVQPPWDDSSLLPLLQNWALPAEREAGLMVLAPLDKVPFTSAARYQASHSFFDFHLDATGQRAQASVVLCPFRAFTALSIQLSGSAAWRLGGQSGPRSPNEPFTLILEGPADLAGHGDVKVLLVDGNRVLAVLRVEPDAAVGPCHAFQVKQVSAYLDERWRKEKSGFHGATAADFKNWQVETRQRLHNWMNAAVISEAPLKARLMERQSGSHCVREKILIQTEPDLWLPLYLVRPKQVPVDRKLPAILFPHGSCAGKSLFAPDERGDEQNTALLDQWPSPYQLAHQMGCLVLIPDRRGWGEWSEANHGQRSQRAWNAGFNIAAMDVWDHVRALDYLVQRPDVDARRMVSMGGSGGGWMTLLLLGVDERLSGGIVSSTITSMPDLPDQYFFRTLADEKARINPTPQFPLAPATILSLAAPRAVWIMDGLSDPCYAMTDKLPRTAEETRADFAHWHADANAGREEVARIYRLLGASGNYQASWFDGGHLAGFTFQNIAPWLKEKFAI